MKSFLAGVGFLALLIASNAVAAFVMWSVATILERLVPEASDSVWPWFIAGLIGLAVSIAFLIGIIRLIGQWRRQGSARAPA